MFGRILLASVVAGVVAGVVLTAVQSVTVTPLITAAETYEAGAGEAAVTHRHGGLRHAHALGGSSHDHDGYALVLPADERVPAGGRFRGVGRGSLARRRGP